MIFSKRLFTSFWAQVEIFQRDSSWMILLSVQYLRNRQILTIYQNRFDWVSRLVFGCRQSFCFNQIKIFFFIHHMFPMLLFLVIHVFSEWHLFVNHLHSSRIASSTFICWVAINGSAWCNRLISHLMLFLFDYILRWHVVCIDGLTASMVVLALRSDCFFQYIFKIFIALWWLLWQSIQTLLMFILPCL